MAKQIDVLLSIKAVKNIKALADTRADLLALRQAGVNVNKPLAILDKKLNKAGVSAKKATRAFGRFKMEMLSVMFFGMAMGKMFGGLLKPAAQLVGLFELWSATLQIVFLPIMLQLLELLLPFMNWLMELPEPVKMAIGVFALLGFIIGKILFTIGTMSLGIMGLSKAFGGAAIGGKIFSAIGSIFTATGAIVVGVIALIIGIIIGMKQSWDTNFMGMKATVANVVDFFKMTFGGLADFLKGLFDIIKGLFTGNGELVVAGLKKAFFGLIKFIVGIVGFIASALAAIATGIIKLIWNILKALWGVIKSLWSFIMDGLSWVWDKIKAIGGAISNFFKGGKGNKDGGGKSSKAQGGYIPHTGLYKMHAGETVNQSNSSFSPNITINASSGMDIDRMKQSLSTQWNEELNGMSRR